MATLTVWKFPTALGAEQAEHTLEQLSKQELIKIHDAAIVSFPEGAKKPKTRQLNNLTGAGALGGSFWGLLFGLIFFVPLLGMAIGAGLGALSGSMADVGIDDDFIKAVRDEVQPEPYPGQPTWDVYIDRWLGLHTEVAIERTTGVIKSVLVEID